MVHVLGRKANGAKLPSGGLGLNASKSESRLVNATITKLPLIGRLNYVKPFDGFTEKAPCVSILVVRKSGVAYTGIYHMQCWGAKPFADDLVTERGVVLSRAATTLRSVETYPTFGWFVVSFF